MRQKATALEATQQAEHPQEWSWAGNWAGFRMVAVAQGEEAEAPCLAVVMDEAAEAKVVGVGWSSEEVADWEAEEAAADCSLARAVDS